jgi:hypothetical protein
LEFWVRPTGDATERETGWIGGGRDRDAVSCLAAWLMCSGSDGTSMGSRGAAQVSLEAREDCGLDAADLSGLTGHGAGGRLQRWWLLEHGFNLMAAAL